MHHASRLKLAAFATIVAIASLTAVATADTSGATPAAAEVRDAGPPDAGPGPDAQPLPHEQLPSVDQPGAVLQAVTEAKSHGGYIAMGMIVLYVLGSWLVRSAGNVGWLAQGRRLVLITSAVGVIGALVDHFAGSADWQTVVAAVGTGIGKFLVPLHQTA